ncbi:SspB family protein [Microvirga sp. 2MCAF38]|uniref:SspB family protein n=1 Tax=Microvirga sp. 2MCAF38 TaxID=3232989 RepID=UPI003F966030
MAGKDLIRYDLLVQDALKGVVRRVLIDAGKDGLPGEHHFYISFRTDFPGVRLSNRLREKYPQEMTIILQHQFWDLIITEHTFEVGLSFSGVPERLLIPFDALTGFFDPSVQFGLKFDQEGDEDEVEEESAEAPAAPSPIRGAASEPVELKRPKKTPAAAKNEAKKDVSSEVEVSPQPEEKTGKGEKSEGNGAEVVSLDSFRKKN